MSESEPVSFVKSRTIISPNQHALIRLPSEGLKIVQLKPGGIISLGKFGSFAVDGVLGYPFGQSFEIIDRNAVKPVKSLAPGLQTEESEDLDLDREETPDVESISKDDLTSLFSANSESNQQIIDIGSKIQSLSSKEIDELKQSGASSNIGQQIIEKIIAGHGGFDKKTIFSQEKYLRRKQQKFLRRFTVDYIGSSELLQYYIEKDLPRVLDLSEETLGLILSYGNVRPGGKYLLVDDTGGVILYSMLERMNGQGTIVLAHENEHPNHIALRYSDYPEELIQRVVKPINWLQFLEPENEKIDLEIVSEEELEAMKPSKRIQHEKRTKRAQEINNVIDLVQGGGFDGFISVSTIHLPTLLPEVLPVIGGSRPIVLYSQYKEHLLETQHSLSNDKRVLAPSIFETRVRPYQTIIGRLHPLMTMRGFGGYVLWGTRVLPQENITAVGRGVSRKKKEEPKEPKEEEKADEVPENTESSN